MKPILFLTLLFFTIKCVVGLLINYWQIIVTCTSIVLTLILLGWIITLVLKQRKIREVRESDVILIPSQTVYSIPIEVKNYDYKTKEGGIKSRWMVMSLRPELHDNNLIFVKLSHELARVKVLNSQSEPQDSNYETTKQISSLTKEIFFEINPQLSKFKQQDGELEKLEKLVSSSDLYQSKVELYRRARVQLQELIEQETNLKQEYCKFIREILIGAEISQFDPNSMSGILETKLALHSKYENFKTNYEDKKNEINIYLELTKKAI